MGLSFDEGTSLRESTDSFRFVANDTYSIPELRNIEKENDSSDNDDIQMSERRSTSDTTEKSIELKDSCIHEGDLESVTV